MQTGKTAATAFLECSCWALFSSQLPRQAAAQPGPEEVPAAATYRAGQPVLPSPALAVDPQPPAIQPAQPASTDRVLPINLATALYLSNARPLVIASAQASVQQAAAQLEGARVLWLPDVHFAIDYFHHSGLDQSSTGSMAFSDYNAFAAGGGPTMNFAVTEAIFQPLAARQQLVARQWDVQTAQRRAVERGAKLFRRAGMRGAAWPALDSAAKADQLVRHVESLAGGLVAAFEVDR